MNGVWLLLWSSCYGECPFELELPPLSIGIVHLKHCLHNDCSLSSRCRGAFFRGQGHLLCVLFGVELDGHDWLRGVGVFWRRRGEREGRGEGGKGEGEGEKVRRGGREKGRGEGGRKGEERGGGREKGRGEGWRERRGEGSGRGRKVEREELSTVNIIHECLHRPLEPAMNPKISALCSRVNDGLSLNISCAIANC